MSSKKPPDLLNLERDIPTTPEDVLALQLQQRADLAEDGSHLILVHCRVLARGGNGMEDTRSARAVQAP